MVTHLPQVAAYADRHLVVRKASDGHITSSGVHALDGDERLRELARMMGGVDTESALDHARELVEETTAPPRHRTSALTREPVAAVRCTSRRPRGPRGIPMAHGRMGRMPLKIPRQRAREPESPGVRGLVRVDARTKNLTKRLRPGEIAVIDHQDIDKVSAEALLACKPAAVVNAAPSISGRYPNLGPEILVDAGIPLLDNVGKDVMHDLTEGQQVRLDGDQLWVGDEVVAKGQAFDHELVQSSMNEARAGLAVQLEAFAANTMEYLRRERDLLLDGVGVPDITTEIDGRHALIVVRGYHYKEDLRTLRSYIREYRPVLIGVDGGADALVEVGLKPDLIVGDMDSVSDATLRCGAEIVVHAYRDGNAPGLERVARARGRAGRLPGHRDQRGRRDAARRRQGCRAHRRRRHPRHPRRVPRQGPQRHGQHLPHPAAGRRQAHRRQGRQPALPLAHLQPVPAAHAAGRPERAVRGALVHHGRAGVPPGARRPVGRPLVLRRRNCHVIDFRYHLVSIVSIFLALAVGIVLGAGPLKEDIGNTLTSEVKNLRADKAALRAELDVAEKGTRRATSSPRPATAACSRSGSRTRR